MPHFNGQALQDKFVLNVLKNKKNGTFLDMGAHEPIHINNTYIGKVSYSTILNIFELGTKSIAQNLCMS